jgi:hypothetical protein
MRSGLLVLVAASTLLVTTSSRADDDYNMGADDYAYATQQENDFIDRTEFDMVEDKVVSPSPSGSSSQTSTSAPSTASAPAPAPDAPVIVDIGPSPIAPKQMAAKYPAASQAKMEQVFDTLLTTHHQLEDHFGIPRGDLAFALAIFIIGAYVAHHHQMVPDEYVAPLVEQIRRKLNASAASNVGVSP